MPQPIRPEDIAEAKIKHLPACVFEVFNEFIAKHFSGKSARFLQKDVVAVLATRMNVQPHDIYDMKILNVEEAYRAVGRNVFYDKPAYNESGEPAFEFSKP